MSQIIPVVWSLTTTTHTKRWVGGITWTRVTKNVSDKNSEEISWLFLLLYMIALFFAFCPDYFFTLLAYGETYLH